MARPNKTGLDYFPFDVDFFADEKIAAISGEFGIKGEITVIKLLCAVYRNGYFILWNEPMKYKMLRDLPGISAELIDQIVNRLVRWGFFDEGLFDSVKVLTNRHIQLKWIKLANFVGEDFIKSPLNLMKDVHVPAYKLSDKVRMYQHDVKRWYGIMKEVFRRDNYTCQYCGAKGVKLEVDHIIPFSRGGSDDLSNLTTSCRRCNRQKKDKTIKEFLIWKEKNK